MVCCGALSPSSSLHAQWQVLRGVDYVRHGHGSHLQLNALLSSTTSPIEPLPYYKSKKFMQTGLLQANGFLHHHIKAQMKRTESRDPRVIGEEHRPSSSSHVTQDNRLCGGTLLSIAFTSKE